MNIERVDVHGPMFRMEDIGSRRCSGRLAFEWDKPYFHDGRRRSPSHPNSAQDRRLGLIVIIRLRDRDVLVTIPADALHINPGTFPVQVVVVSMMSLQIDRSLTGR